MSPKVRDTGETIRSIREAAHLSLADAAAATGLAPWVLAEIEEGRRRATSRDLGRLARLVAAGVLD